MMFKTVWPPVDWSAYIGYFLEMTPFAILPNIRSVVVSPICQSEQFCCSAL